MDRVTSYAVSDLPHAPSYRIPQLPVFQAKTRCGCPSCHNSLSTVGHSSRQVGPPEEDSGHHRHHHHHHHSHQTNINSHLNTCTRTCFSQLAGHLIPHVPAGSSCSCYSHVQHVPPTPHPPPPPPPAPYTTRMSGGACPCCQHSSLIRPSSETPHSYHISRLHLAADNITNHPPHYADAFAPPPLLHASWEPTGGVNMEPHRPQALRHVYISSPSPTHSSTQEYHMHTHHHQQISTRRRAHCPVGPENLRNLEQELHTLASRHYRRFSGRSSSYPYPAGLFHPASELYIREPLLRLEEPAATAIPMTVPYFIEEEGEPGQLEYDWLEINGGARVSEPKGITKEMLTKLPSYYVTKKILEDYNDNDRCVICMCEYDVDERLRVLPCDHEFHCACIDKWLSTNPTCPICRSIVEVT